VPTVIFELFARRRLAKDIPAVAEKEPGVEAAGGMGRRDRPGGAQKRRVKTEGPRIGRAQLSLRRSKSRPPRT